MTIAALTGTGTPPIAQTRNDAGSEDRFLKLLVAQMRNQDPLNPMDNAQVTSQMAQINTVAGIEKLNTTVVGLNAQFAQLQVLQGASLVGRDVIVEGTRLSIADGVAQGGFDLTAPADRVTVEILGPDGRVIDTLDLGARGQGRHGFDWPAGSAGDGAGLRFRIDARSGAAALVATPMMRDRVDAVSMQNDGLRLELERAGPVAWSDIKAFN